MFMAQEMLKPAIDMKTYFEKNSALRWMCIPSSLGKQN